MLCEVGGTVKVVFYKMCLIYVIFYVFLCIFLICCFYNKFMTICVFSYINIYWRNIFTRTCVCAHVLFTSDFK